jgi:hypothetical protein
MDSRTTHPHDDRPPAATAEAGLGAEVRESLLLLGVSIAVTATVTVAAQAALTLLG